MNSQRHLLATGRKSILLVLLIAILLATVTTNAQQQTQSVVAGEIQSTSPQTEIEGTEIEGTEIETGIEATQTQKTAKQTPPASGAAQQPVSGFEPSEQIGADSAVSFPIDI